MQAFFIIFHLMLGDASIGEAVFANKYTTQAIPHRIVKKPAQTPLYGPPQKIVEMKRKNRKRSPIDFILAALKFNNKNKKPEK